MSISDDLVLDEVVEDISEDERHERLTEATARIRGRRLEPDRWLEVAGWVLMPLGALLILVGYYGTARTSRVWEQIPYVVSGGLLGLGLMFAGGFCYFAHWLTRLIQDSRNQATEAREAAEEATAALQRIELAVLNGNGNGSRSRAPAKRAAGGSELVATATGRMAHRADCPMVAGRKGLRSVDPSDPNLRPCLVCEPPLTPQPRGRAAGGRRR